MLINPKPETVKDSLIKDYEKVYQESIKNPEIFWENIAKELSWYKPWDKVLDWEYPYARWFVGGQTNIVYNALDRWLKTPIDTTLVRPSQSGMLAKDRLALIWVGQDMSERKFTYSQLNEEVGRFANGLKSLGVKKGDKITIYLPRIPEQFIAMLACLKIGAVHSVVYSGFSAEALKNRIEDAQAKIVICSNSYPYGKKIIESKKNVDEALKENKTVKHVIVVERMKLDKIGQSQIQSDSIRLNPIPSNSIYVMWNDLMSKQSADCPTEIMESSDPAFILYTSGCCHKDTLIQLSTGEIRRIEELVKKKGTNVTNINMKTLFQQNDKITNKHCYNEEPYLIKIKTTISSGLFTPNHPFFILNSEGEIIEKPGYLLKTGDHVMMSKRIDFNGKPQLLPDSKKTIYHEEKSTKGLPNKPTLPKYLNSDFAQLLGFFTGDGSLKKGTVEITDKDIDNLLYYQSLTNKLNLRSYLKKYDRQRLLTHSRFFSIYLKENFPEVFQSSHFRDIPVIIQKSNKEVVAGFIRGLYDAEGSVVVKGRTVKIVSTSKFLIQKLKFLLLRFAVVTSYSEEIRKTHFKNKEYVTQVFELRITDRESLITFDQQIGFSSRRKQKKLKELLTILSKKRIASMIYLLPFNKLIKKLRQTLRLNKKEFRRVFLDSYLYTSRKTTIKHLPSVINYLKQIIKEINNVDLNSIQSIRKAIFLFKISQKTLARVSGKSENTVHKYIHTNKTGISNMTLNNFIKTIVPFLKKIKNEKENIIAEIYFRLKKLEKLRNIGFFEIKKITTEKNDSDFDSVYDLTTEKNHNYLANGFIVHNSTGAPKGVLHGHGGYMVGIYATLKMVFDILPDDIFWSTADAGWITGHSYILYSPLINGITTFVYEGTPDYPDIEIWWKLIEKYKVTKFYTAPTAIRALMRFGEEHIKKYDFSSLKILGSVGEPINPEAWLWFYKNIGREKIPIMDTWWQTETGMFMIAPVPSVSLKPGSAFKPFFGIEADVVDEKGNQVPINTQGYLIIKKPWPAMFLDVYNNPERYKETYFEKIQNTKSQNPNKSQSSNSKLQTGEAKIPVLSNHQGPLGGVAAKNAVSNFENFIYFAGDSAKIDEDGYYWIVGRNDDVIKVSGHRLGSAEIESAFVENKKVAEAAVIGKPHEVKGESIKAFVILKQGVAPSDELKIELVQSVRKSIGPIATPDEIEFVEKLPKTRSGKIMRRVLKAQELGLPVGDTSTLES